MLSAPFRRRRPGSRPNSILVAAATTAVYFALSGCGGAHSSHASYGGALEHPAAPIDAAEEAPLHAAPPPFSAGVFPCSRCHGPGPADADGPVYPHTVHLDKGLECADCHDDDADPSPAGAELCDECHEVGDRGSERATLYFAAMVESFPSRWTANVEHVAHDVHAENDIGCEECHGGIGDEPIRKPGSAVLMRRCTTCHLEREAPNECDTCHAPGTPRPHETVVLSHAEEQRGCLDCHDEQDRDVLHLANGEIVPFSESYRLCGQCHGPRLRDWRLGLHGKRTGRWDGEQETLLCAHCHDPHSPRFPSMTPLPPPSPPKEPR